MKIWRLDFSFAFIIERQTNSPDFLSELLWHHPPKHFYQFNSEKKISQATRVFTENNSPEECFRSGKWCDYLIYCYYLINPGSSEINPVATAATGLFEKRHHSE